MKHLTLIRHAKSDWHSAARSDFERPLNQRGQKAAPLMGRRLATRGGAADLLLVSPAERARRTAELIAAELDEPPPIDYVEAIYDADLSTLIELLHNLDDDLHEVILVGHNPGVTELGRWLCSQAPHHLPTCALLEFELPLMSWSDLSAGCAELRLYDFPKNPSPPAGSPEPGQS